MTESNANGDKVVTVLKILSMVAVVLKEAWKRY